ncbi:hypothetical protein NFJ02_23g51440 [Pycnococcus provasolii]
MAASLLITRAYKTAPPAGGALSAPVVGARRADWCDASCREHLIVAKSANELENAYEKVKEEWGNSGRFVPANVAYACGTWTLSLAKDASHRWRYCVHKASSAREIADEVERKNKNMTDKNNMWYLVSATAGDGEWIYVRLAQVIWSWQRIRPINLRTGIVNAYALAVQSGKNYRVAHLVGDGKRSGVAVMVSTNSTASVAEKVVITRGVSDIFSHVSGGYKAEPNMYLRAVAVMGCLVQVTCLQTNVVKEFYGGEYCNYSRLCERLAGTP